MLNGLDLFSGIGGFTLAVRSWIRPVAYCENDPHAQAVLLSRMADRQLPQAPIWDDVRTLRAEHFGVPVDVIYGGFPCQDISSAGRRIGLAGKRSGLVNEFFRLIGELKPAFVLMENVADIRVRGAEAVGKELACRGYDSRWTLLPASELGFPHRRIRWFLAAADANRFGLQEREEFDADARRKAQRGHAPWAGVQRPSAGTSSRKIQPRVDRTGDGIPCRVDRIKGVGNAVVPLQAEEAFKRLIGLEVEEIECAGARPT